MTKHVFETQPDVDAPKRAVLYLRVGTGRQAAGDVSLPSRREITTKHCIANGWQVVDEFVEAGASAADDRWPLFQQLMERAYDADQPFDKIVIYAYNRFIATTPRLTPERQGSLLQILGGPAIRQNRRRRSLADRTPARGYGHRRTPAPPLPLN